MEIYLVGGAVRDKLLNIPVKERDWVVVGAEREEMAALGFRRLDRDFPVYAHPETGEEYALARTEEKNAPGHKGFKVYAGPDVTLHDDLRRRDLTINAMAESEDGTLVDPFDGREDLDSGLLRHVSPAFIEDPLRVLRVARFAARFAQFGFRVSHGTHALMKRVAREGELATLSSGRIWQETERALSERHPGRYFEVLHRCGALKVIMPELAPALGGAAHAAHTGSRPMPAMLALAEAAELTSDPVARFAALVVGLTAAPDGAEGDGETVEAVCKRLKVPAQYRELALLTYTHCKLAGIDAGAQPPDIVKALESVDAFRRPERFERFLKACQAAMSHRRQGTAEAVARLRAAYTAAANIDASRVTDRSLDGQAMGAEIRRLRAEAVAEVLC